MKSKNILVELCYQKAGKLSSHTETEPFSIECVGSLAAIKGHNINLFQQRDKNINEIVREIIKEKPQLVGISCYTFRIPDALELARLIKKENSKTFVGIGGYHASYVPETVLYEPIDFLAIGMDGEKVFLDLVDTLDSGNSIKNIKGIVTKENYKEISEFFKNPIKLKQYFLELRKDFNFINKIWPLRNKELFENTGVAGITPFEIGEYKLAQVQYSRGCPFSCSYCASHILSGNFVKYRNPKDVVNEMEFLKEKYGIDLFFFVDLTFNLPKVADLLKELKSKNLPWIAMPSIDVGNMNYEMLKSMKEAGNIRLMFGVESLDEKIGVQEYGRKCLKNITRFDAIYNVFRDMDKLGITSRSFLIFGAENEKPEDIQRYSNLLKKLLPDEIRIAIFTPLHGSPIWWNKEVQEKIKYKNFPEDWRRYSTRELIINSNHFKEGELEKLCENIWKEYYESKEYADHFYEKFFINHQKFKKGAKSFYKWLKNNGIKNPFLEKYI